MRYNDTLLPNNDYAAPVPVDPGMVVVSAEAPNHNPWSTEIDASGEGNVVYVTVPLLTSGDGDDGPVEETGGGSSWTGWHTAGVVVGAVGVVGMVASAIMASSAKFKRRRSRDALRHDRVHADGDRAERRRAVARQRGDGCVFVAGAIVTALGATFLIIGLTSGGDDDSSDKLSLSPAGLSYRW